MSAGAPMPSIELDRLRHGLVAEYLFSGNAQDSSGNGHHAQVVGAALTSDRFGNPDSAYAFDGKDDYIIVASPPELSAQTLTVSVWVRYEESEFRGWCNAIVAQDSDEEFWHSYERHGRVFQLATRDRQITWHRMRGPGGDVKARLPLQVGAWHHIVAVVDDGTHRLYVDGELHDQKESWFISNPDQPLYIGRKTPPNQSMFFRGAIDDLRIYNRALSAQEVQVAYRENGWSPAPREAYNPHPAPLHWQGADWTSLDIDTPAQGGSTVQGDHLVVHTGGVNIGIRSDSFHYVYQSIDGDFTACVTLVDAPDSEPWGPQSKSGLMLRAGLEPDAPYVALFGTGDNAIRMQWRDEPGGMSKPAQSGGWQNHKQPLQLKLERSGQTISAFSSTDGESWTAIGEPTSINWGGAPIYIGPAASLNSFGNVEPAVFADWRLTHT